MADTPEHATGQWLAAVEAGDLVAAWAVTDRTLRIALAQLWLYTLVHGQMTDAGGRARDVVAEAIADDGPGRKDWLEVSAWLETLLRRDYGLFIEHGSRILDANEIVSLDLEYVRAAVAGDHGPAIAYKTFTMRLEDDEWRVAGFGRALPVPGWPPLLQPLDAQPS